MPPMRELPPTAGLPLQWQDFWPGQNQQEDFETGLAEFLGTAAVQVECSGTVCLLIALETLKRESNRRTVIIPAYTCPLVPMAIEKAGLHVKICDTQPDCFDFDIDVLSRLCDDDTLCVVPTHLAGLVTDLAPVIELARHCGAWIVEDAAHALGANWHGQPVGTVGDIGFYSFAAGKGLTLYEGGAMVARDAVLRKKLVRTSQDTVPVKLGWELLRMVQLAGYGLFYNPFGLSFTYGANMRYWLKKGDPVNAAGEHFTQIPVHKVSSFRKQVGASALTRLRQHLLENVERGRRRAERLKAIDGLTVLQELPGTFGTWPAIMITLPTPEACQRALAELWTRGLGVTKLFIHDLSSYEYLRHILPGINTPNARCLAQRSLTVSNSAWITEQDFQLIEQVLRKSIHNLPEPHKPLAIVANS